MADEKLYGPDGHTGGYGTMEGRKGGGGWVDDCLAFGAMDGLGIWAQPPAQITGINHGTPPGPGNPSPDFLDLVTGWHKTFLLPRQR